MTQAEQMLRSEPTTMEDVAKRSGYGNPSHFAAEFKQRLGITPSDRLAARKIGLVTRSKGDLLRLYTTI
jgi:AraC-like DNA-binding protein